MFFHVFLDILGPEDFHLSTLDKFPTLRHVGWWSHHPASWGHDEGPSILPSTSGSQRILLHSYVKTITHEMATSILRVNIYIYIHMHVVYVNIYIYMYIWGSAPHLYQWPQLTPYNKTQKNKMTLVVCGCHSKVVVFLLFVVFLFCCCVVTCVIFFVCFSCGMTWVSFCLLVSGLICDFILRLFVWGMICICVCVCACFVLLFVVKCVFLLCFFLWHDMCSFVFALLFRDLHFVVWSAFFWCSFSW